MHIQRAVYEEFKRRLKPQKVLILLGPRRVGKTELIKRFLKEQDPTDYLLLNGEDQETIDLLAERSIRNYRQLMGDKRLLLIDEAQKVPDVGLKLKLMVDSIEDIQIVATGSSVFDLSSKLGEPLVGRANNIRLYPLAQMEFAKEEDYSTTAGKLEERLIFGGYPELEQIDSWEEKIEYLDDAVSSNLIRDILEYKGVRKSTKIMDLLRLIAFQVGNEVKLDELAVSLKDIDRGTVESYLDLLSKVFIIYNVKGFSRNLRKEITKTSRWYFYDNGIRNAIIRNFSKLSLRADIGMLWENYLMAERMKYNTYTKRLVNPYFWRTYDKQEIDLIEEEEGQLRAYEFKWNSNKKVRAPGGWKKGYPDATFELITPANYLEFISKKE